MGSLVDELQRRDGGSCGSGAAARADRGAGGASGRVEEQLSRLVIARRWSMRCWTGLPRRYHRCRGQSQVVLLRRAGPAPVPGVLAVPPWRAGLDASVLPRDYRDLLEVAADAGRPLRVGQIAAAAGLSTDRGSGDAAGKTEAAGRSGWLAEEAGPGLLGFPCITAKVREKRQTGVQEASLPRFAGANQNEPDPEEEPYVKLGMPRSGCQSLHCVGGSVHDPGRATCSLVRRPG